MFAESLKIDDQNKSTILTIWLTCEVISLVLEPLFFQILVPWLNKANDDDVKHLYKDYKQEKKKRDKEL